MIIAIAVLGLSASLVNEQICNSEKTLCQWALKGIWGHRDVFRTTRYSTFLGIYGILTGAVGTISLFVDSIPTIAPLLGDGIGALLFLAGGIAWMVDIENLPMSCGKYKKLGSDYWYAKPLASTCRRCEADHGLVWALFAFTAGLYICDYVRRRQLVQSAKSSTGF